MKGIDKATDLLGSLLEPAPAAEAGGKNARGPAAAFNALLNEAADQEQAKGEGARGGDETAAGRAALAGDAAQPRAAGPVQPEGGARAALVVGEPGIEGEHASAGELRTATGQARPAAGLPRARSIHDSITQLARGTQPLATRERALAPELPRAVQTAAQPEYASESADLGAPEGVYASPAPTAAEAPSLEAVLGEVAAVVARIVAPAPEATAAATPAPTVDAALDGPSSQATPFGAGVEPAIALPARLQGELRAAPERSGAQVSFAAAQPSQAGQSTPATGQGEPRAAGQDATIEPEREADAKAREVVTPAPPTPDALAVPAALAHTAQPALAHTAQPAPAPRSQLAPLASSARRGASELTALAPSARGSASGNDVAAGGPNAALQSSAGQFAASPAGSTPGAVSDAFEAQAVNVQAAAQPGAGQPRTPEVPTASRVQGGRSHASASLVGAPSPLAANAPQAAGAQPLAAGAPEADPAQLAGSAPQAASAQPSAANEQANAAQPPAGGAAQVVPAQQLAGASADVARRAPYAGPALAPTTSGPLAAGMKTALPAQAAAGVPASKQAVIHSAVAAAPAGIAPNVAVAPAPPNDAARNVAVAPAPLSDAARNVVAAPARPNEAARNVAVAPAPLSDAARNVVAAPAQPNHVVANVAVASAQPNGAVVNAAAGSAQPSGPAAHAAKPKAASTGEPIAAQPNAPAPVVSTAAQVVVQATVSAAPAAGAERESRAQSVKRTAEPMARIHGFTRGALGHALSAYSGRGHEGAEHDTSRGKRAGERAERELEAGATGQDAFLPVQPEIASVQLQAPAREVPQPEAAPRVPAAPMPAPVADLPEIEFQGRAPAAQPEGASIALHHPDLGPIQLEVHRDRGRVEVHAVIESAHAEAVLRANERGIRQGVQQSGMALSALRVRMRGENSETARAAPVRRRRANERET